MRTIKKLSFNEVKATKMHELNVYEMSKLVGGSGGWPSSGTCGYKGVTVNDSHDVLCYKSKEEVMFWFGSGGDDTRWCCDSCHEASWWQEGCNSGGNTGGGDGSGGPIEIPSGTDPGSGDWGSGW